MRRLGVKACINCGACSYVCPAKRYLSQRINFAKDYILGKKGKKANSSEYVLIEGQDIPLFNNRFDKIINPEENIFDIEEKQKNSAVEEMLQIIAHQEKKGGENNEE